MVKVEVIAFDQISVFFVPKNGLSNRIGNGKVMSLKTFNEAYSPCEEASNGK